MARWSSTRVLLELTVLLHTHLQILFFFFSIFKFFVSDRSEILWTDLSSLQVMRQGYKSLEKQIKTGIICSAPENPLRSGWHKLSVSVRVCEDLCSSFFFFFKSPSVLCWVKRTYIAMWQLRTSDCRFQIITGMATWFYSQLYTA